MVAGTIGVRGVAVAAVIPALAVGAHALASGVTPGPLGIALCIALGLLAGMCTRPRCGRLALLAILSIGQALSHLALSVGMPAAGHMGGHPMGAHPMGGQMMPGASHGHGGPDMMSAPTSMLTDHLATLTHPGSIDGVSMLVTHLVAIPLCAILIGLAAAVATMATGVVAALTQQVTPPVRGATHPVRHEPAATARRIDRAAGAGTRGPPVLLALA